MASSLADTLAAASARKTGYDCRLAVWLRTRPDVDAIVDAFRDTRVRAQPLSDWLNGEGVAVSQNSVYRHRRGQCAQCTIDGHDMRLA